MDGWMDGMGLTDRQMYARECVCACMHAYGGVVKHTTLLALTVPLPPSFVWLAHWRTGRRSCRRFCSTPSARGCTVSRPSRYTHTFKYIHIHTYIYVYISCLHIHRHTHIHIYIFIYAHTHIYIYMIIYIHIHSSALFVPFGDD